MVLRRELGRKAVDEKSFAVGIGVGYQEDPRWAKQEAHGPRFAHLSDIATADMQMLCNIFRILSSQVMKISSFEQFLDLKKNIWA